MGAHSGDYADHGQIYLTLIIHNRDRQIEIERETERARDQILKDESDSYPKVLVSFLMGVRDKQSIIPRSPLGLSQPMRDEGEAELQNSPPASCLEREAPYQRGGEFFLCVSKCLL